MQAPDAAGHDGGANGRAGVVEVAFFRRRRGANRVGPRRVGFELKRKLYGPGGGVKKAWFCIESAVAMLCCLTPNWHGCVWAGSATRVCTIIRQVASSRYFFVAPSGGVVPIVVV